MRGKTALFFVLAVSISLLLSSCSSLVLFGKGQQKEIAVTEESLRTGTDSLVMSFYKDTPPQKVHVNQAIPLALVLSNKGASDIKNGRVILSYEGAFLENINEPWQKYNVPISSAGDFFTFDLEGKSINNPQGETQVYSKNFEAKSIGENRQSIDVSFTAYACYDYETKKSIPICIDPIKYQETSKPCQIQALTLDSQGGPLAITKVEPELVSKGNGYELSVKIYLQNKGKGLLYKKGGTDEACKGKAKWNILEEGDFDLRLGSDEQNNFKCSPFPIDISEKDSFIKCIYNPTITETQPYTTTLFVDITYGYKSQGISAQTTILRKI